MVTAITTTARSVRWWMSLALAGMLAFAACGDDGADETSDGDIDADEVEDAEAVEAEVSRGEHVSSPRVTGPVAGGARGLPFPPMPTRLADEFGYIEEEFFIVGEATAYEPEGTWDEDGEWAARPTSTAPYETRILVRRPEAGAFNGTVVVEWLNVTTGLDLDNEFRFAHEELLREGYAWVGASAQQVGIEGGDGVFPGYPGLEEILALKEWDPERYRELDHPGDDYSYDIFSQVAQAIRRPDGVDPLEGLAVQQVIAAGQSQSAAWLVTYVNAVHSIADIYDGFMIHSRFGWALPLAQDAADTNPAVARIRIDLSDPVMQFQTETDVFLFGGFHPARQPDTEHVRTWEVAGTAHLDQTLVDIGTESVREWDDSYDRGLTGCRANDGPHAVVLQAAWAALTEWVGGGEPPPTAQPLEIRDDALARDQHGHALGGVRTPAVDAPISTLTGEDDCVRSGTPLDSLYGSATPFDQATLRSLYPTHRDYIDAVTSATQVAVDAGFLLPINGAAIIAEAEQAPIPE
jgi:Alpha/beta hydrolase domain